MKDLLLRLLRVPPEPHPPAGSPESIRIFRAAPNYYYWTLFRWLFLQVFVGAMFLGLFLILAQAMPKFPPLARTIVVAVETIIILIFAMQLPVTFWKQKLDYEMRWYIVTDRSLRIRAGIWSVREITMTFANLQKVQVEQGPLQRLLGIADVSAQSAGGRVVATQHGSHSTAGAHIARFEGVAIPNEIRDLILDRVRRYRDAGLGDPDDHPLPGVVEAGNGTASGTDVLEAAKVVLAEARAIHITGAHQVPETPHGGAA
jgi:membrane protein YdbS with pleckstrin-like domain